MLPTGEDFQQQPLESLRTTWEVWKLTQLHDMTNMAAKRKRSVDDVEKRAEYRKAHGINDDGGWGMWTAKADAQALQPKRQKWFGIF